MQFGTLFINNLKKHKIIASRILNTDKEFSSTELHTYFKFIFDFNIFHIMLFKKKITKNEFNILLKRKIFDQ